MTDDPELHELDTSVTTFKVGFATENNFLSIVLIEPPVSSSPVLNPGESKEFTVSIPDGILFPQNNGGTVQVSNRLLYSPTPSQHIPEIYNASLTTITDSVYENRCYASLDLQTVTSDVYGYIERTDPVSLDDRRLKAFKVEIRNDKNVPAQVNRIELTFSNMVALTNNSDIFASINAVNDWFTGGKVLLVDRRSFVQSTSVTDAIDNDDVIKFPATMTYSRVGSAEPVRAVANLIGVTSNGEKIPLSTSVKEVTDFGADQGGCATFDDLTIPTDQLSCFDYFFVRTFLWDHEDTMHSKARKAVKKYNPVMTSPPPPPLPPHDP